MWYWERRKRDAVVMKKFGLWKEKDNDGAFDDVDAMWLVARLKKERCRFRLPPPGLRNLAPTTPRIWKYTQYTGHSTSTTTINAVTAALE
jgi:hypothetical protein